MTNYDKSAYYLRTPKAAVYCGLSKSTLDKLRLYGDGPPYSKIGRAVIYRKADLDSWLSANKHSSTSEY